MALSRTGDRLCRCGLRSVRRAGSLGLVEGSCPPGQEVERVFRRRARLGRVSRRACRAGTFQMLSGSAGSSAVNVGPGEGFFWLLRTARVVSR
jgi:hypothetical protein